LLGRREEVGSVARHGLTSVASSLLIAWASQAAATDQIRDVIMVSGQQYRLSVSPLASYLARNTPRWPQGEVTTTANWRGYVAKWAVDDGRLMLTDIRVNPESDRERSALSQVFPEGGPIIADWFTGQLVLPDGAELPNGEAPMRPEYDHYLILRVRSGVVRRHRIDYSQFVQLREIQFAAFRETAEYRELLDRIRRGQVPYG
jgi:hypothetical protein